VSTSSAGTHRVFHPQRMYAFGRKVTIVRNNIGVAFVILEGMWLSLAVAQTSRPGATEERFVTTTRLPGKDVVRQLLWFDPATGREIVMDQTDSREFPDVSFMDSQGKHLKLHRHGRPSSTAPVELQSPPAGAPVRVFQEPEVNDMRPAALSPDGRKIVFYNPSRQSLVIGDDTHVHKLRVEWTLTRPFSWNPDSSQVAFYYAPSLDADDFNIQQHGVALLTLDGKLRVLVKALEATGTPRNSAVKYVPVGWGRSGQYVYYTAGLAPDDHRRQSAAARVLYPPTATYRIDIYNDEIEMIGLGDFACVSPGEEYVLLCPSPKPASDDKWESGTTKVQIQTREVTYLPDEIRCPIISPSGRLVACYGRGPTIRFFETADWKPHGKPVSLSMHSLPSEDWIATFRWIVVDKPDEK